MRCFNEASIRVFVGLLLLALFTGSSFAAHTITNWPDNKGGAVSLTFDDGLPSHQSLAIPALDARGMKGTFFVITDKVASGWGPWKNASLMGHEIGSHTLSHPYLTLLTPSQAQVELQGSQSIIDSAVTSQKAVTIAYPYGDYNYSVQSIARNYYIAARSVSCGLNQDPIDFYGVKACSPDSLDDVYAQTDAAQAQGKWMVFFTHSLDGTGYGDWLIGDLENYLDYLKTKNLWVGTFGSMVKYLKERQSANLFVSFSTADQIVLNLTDTLDDAVYGEPLTIRSEIPGNWTNVTVLQGGSSTTVTPVLEGGVRVIYYHAIPDRGPISLTSTSPGNQAPNGVIDTPLQNVTINMGDIVSFAGTGTDPDGNLPLGYRWSFGIGSGIPDATVEDPGGKQFNIAGIYSVTFTVTDALGLSDPTPDTRVVTVRGAGLDPFLEDGTGLVSMEAEHYQGVIPLGGYAWQPAANAGSSGNGAVQALPDDGPNPLAAGAGPRLDYQVQFSKTGTHYIWIRALAGSPASDSLYVGLDGVTSGSVLMTGLVLDGKTWTWTNKTWTGAVVSLNVTSLGMHTVNVWMRESGIVLDKLVLNTSASYVPTGTGPAETVSSEYVAVGDSITAGSHDDIPADGVGYEPILSTLLTAAKGYPVSVANEGISGTSSADGVISISIVLAKYPTAKYYLVLYGTNDAYIPAVPSGSGLIPGDPGYSGSYKDNMQKIISAILAAGKTPYLAEVPYTSDPLRSNAMIFEYNAAVDELFVSNGITVSPPPFNSYFQAHPGELADGIHPNGTGYQSMANLWFSALPK